MQQAQVIRQTKKSINVTIYDGTLRLVCGCQREMVEDFDHDAMRCLRCDNEVALQEVIDLLGPITEQSAVLLNIVTEAHEAYEPEEEPEGKPKPRRRRSKPATEEADAEG